MLFLQLQGDINQSQLQTQPYIQIIIILQNDLAKRTSLVNPDCILQAKLTHAKLMPDRLLLQDKFLQNLMTGPQMTIYVLVFNSSLDKLKLHNCAPWNFCVCGCQGLSPQTLTWLSVTLRMLYWQWLQSLNKFDYLQFSTIEKFDYMAHIIRISKPTVSASWEISASTSSPLGA